MRQGCLGLVQLVCMRIGAMNNRNCSLQIVIVVPMLWAHVQSPLMCAQILAWSLVTRCFHIGACLI